MLDYQGGIVQSTCLSDERLVASPVSTMLGFVVERILLIWFTFYHEGCSSTKAPRMGRFFAIFSQTIATVPQPITSM